MAKAEDSTQAELAELYRLRDVGDSPLDIAWLAVRSNARHPV